MTGVVRRLDLHDLVQELCEQTQHREFYMRKRKPRYHVTISPPLLVQLDDAVEPKPSVESGASRPASSRPAGAIDAIDTAMRIGKEAAEWLRFLGEPVPSTKAQRLRHHRDPHDTLHRVRRLGALAVSREHCGRNRPRGDCCTYHCIEADVRRWWSWARIVTRWDMPAWQPDNTCPLCDARGTLRIRLVEKLATCIEDACRGTWDELTIGLLAEHIRAENGEGARIDLTIICDVTHGHQQIAWFTPDPRVTLAPIGDVSLASGSPGTYDDPGLRHVAGG